MNADPDAVAQYRLERADEIDYLDRVRRESMQQAYLEQREALHQSKKRQAKQDRERRRTRKARIAESKRRVEINFQRNRYRRELVLLSSQVREIMHPAAEAVKPTPRPHYGGGMFLDELERIERLMIGCRRPA